MATPVNISVNIDLDLWAVAAEVDFLPELASSWDDEPPAHRLAWEVEWWELIGRYRMLHRSWVSGAMTPEQGARFHLLAHEFRQAVPIVKRLGLPLPSAEALY